MSVVLEDGVVRLEGDCWVEDAEVLAQLLAKGASAVDVEDCTRLHGAVVQALLAFGPRITGEPEADFPRLFLLPAVQKALDPASQDDK